MQKEVIVTSVARNLKELRESNRKTLADVAGVIGLSMSYISMIEDGKRSLNIEVAAELAKIYRTNIDIIYRLYQQSKEGREVV
jgi:transcriptional regulator with XRE-family HTH domain